MEHGAIDGVMRFLRGVAALGLAVSAGGAVILVLEANGPEPVSVMAGRGPGSVMLLASDAVGDAPFTAPFAVDLGLDPALLATPPRSSALVESPHHRHSTADLIVATELASALGSGEGDASRLSILRIERTVGGVVGLRALLSDLDDRNGDRLDDDGRFTVTALDGSAVCVTLGAPRVLTRSLGSPIDVDGVPTSGVSWSPFGPCFDSVDPGHGADVRVATSPGTYGGMVTGDVCDVSVLSGTLAADDRLAAAWGAPLEVAATYLRDFIDTLTPVVLLADTAVTDHELRGDRVASRQAILQRGTAVLVDPVGVPRVRCMSGSPLRAPQPLPDDVQFRGEPWPGFSLDVIRRVPAGDRMVKSFVLIDVRTGHSVIKPAGIEGILARLAGPIATPASS
ncbi:MAG: hypothetical protein HZA58_06675 [Acidimicrobiia bacterium]|nr:hypothetical protein [Acidimicrobiia bacterium]